MDPFDRGRAQRVDTDALEEHLQRELEIVRLAVQTGSGTELNRRIESLLANYRPSSASGRFYIAVHLIAVDAPWFRCYAFS